MKQLASEEETLTRDNTQNLFCFCTHFMVIWVKPMGVCIIFVGKS